jgi:hypothetical protein
MIVCAASISLSTRLVDRKVNIHVYDQFDLIKRYNDIIIYMMSHFFEIKSRKKCELACAQQAKYYLYLSLSLITSCKECFWAKLTKYVIVIFCFFKSISESFSLAPITMGGAELIECVFVWLFFVLIVDLKYYFFSQTRAFV